jgi:cytochrome b involved in lipid metabolism
MKKTFFLALALFGFILAGCIGNTQANLNAASPSGEAAVPIPATKNTIFAMDEIAKHDQAGNCWMVINGKVLDLSDFSSHPGGSAYLP